MATSTSESHSSEATVNVLSLLNGVNLATASLVLNCRFRPSGPLVPGDQDGAPIVDRIGEYPIGFGGYSDVWKAKMTAHGGQTSMVALKVLRPIMSDPDRRSKRVTREIQCWKLLRHQNVAPFYGIVYQSNGFPGLVSPWYANGSAEVYLRRHPDVSPMQILWEIAVGIEYLHDTGVVHGDLKGANVMIDNEGHAKLIDFGLSRLIDSDAGLTTATTSSIRSCAPELLRSDDAQVTKSSDIYAFASSALQLLTGDIPYVKVPKSAVYRTVISGVTPRGLSSPLRYSIPRSEYLWAVLERCWLEQPWLRPSISQVKKCIWLLCP